MGGQVGEIRQADGIVPDLSRQMAHFLMRTLEKIVENAQFVHDFERRGMNRVAAKIAQKVGMLLQHDNIHSHAGQQKTQHHASRTASGDTALGTQGLNHASHINREHKYLRTGNQELQLVFKIEQDCRASLES